MAVVVVSILAFCSYLLVLLHRWATGQMLFEVELRCRAKKRITETKLKVSLNWNRTPCRRIGPNSRRVPYVFRPKGRKSAKAKNERISKQQQQKKRHETRLEEHCACYRKEVNELGVGRPIHRRTGEKGIEAKRACRFSYCKSKRPKIAGSCCCCRRWSLIVHLSRSRIIARSATVYRKGE